MPPKGSMFEGKTLDDAVRKGLETLGLSRAEVIINVAEEGSGGFLGLGARPYKVIILPRPGGPPRDDEDFDRERRGRGGRGRDRERRGGRSETSRGDRNGRSGRGGERRTAERAERGERSERSGRGERGGRRPGERRDAAPKAPAPAPAPAPAQAQADAQDDSPAGRRRRRGRRGGRGRRGERRRTDQPAEARGPEVSAMDSGQGPPIEMQPVEARRETAPPPPPAADVVPVAEAPRAAAETRAEVEEVPAPRVESPRAAAPSALQPASAPWAAESAPAPPVAQPGAANPDLAASGKQWTEELMRAMGFEARVTAVADGDRVDVTVEVPDRDDLLTGPKGEVRQAMQHLLNRMVNRGEGSRYHLQLEINDFWQQREDELRRMATDLAAQALEKNEEAVTEYLNSQERRIVHMTLRDDARVKTYALGTGLIKRVAIAPADFPEGEHSDD